MALHPYDTAVQNGMLFLVLAVLSLLIALRFAQRAVGLAGAVARAAVAVAMVTLWLGAGVAFLTCAALAAR